MTVHLLLRTAGRAAQRLPSNSVARASHAAVATPFADPKIGNREVVGSGYNGGLNYDDRVDFPCPAVRYKVITPDIKQLKEKERGDWKKLSLEEKKQLYRASFRQTFAEINAPTGEWKTIIGTALGFASLSLWIYMGMKMFVYSPLPESFNLEHQQAQLKRMIDIGVNPIEGISSQWDYEKGNWKK